MRRMAPLSRWARMPDVPRERKMGLSIRCAECGADMFVVKTTLVSSNTHPKFCDPHIRVRHYKCVKCGRIIKLPARAGKETH